MVSVQNPSSNAVTYEYNENGIRVSSTINGVKTSFLLDANRDYAQVLEEYNNSGTQVSYLYGHDLISQSRNGAKSFYLVDGLGSTRALTDASGVVTDRYIYDAYGNVLSSIGTTQNSYLYTGEQFDAGAGQYYLRDRYYSQAVGRFTRMDKWEGSNDIISQLANPILLNLNKYIYGNSNPIMFHDPKGLSAISIGEIAAGLTIQDILSAITVVNIAQLSAGIILRSSGEDKWDGLFTGVSYGGPIPFSLPQISLTGLILGARNRETKQEGFVGIALAGAEIEPLSSGLPLDYINEEASLSGPSILGMGAFIGEVYFFTEQLGNQSGALFTIGFGSGAFNNSSATEGYKLGARTGFSIPLPKINPIFLPI
ncbi:MAG: RHS repeat domain-containing protein [Pseudanabaena sp.]